MEASGQRKPATQERILAAAASLFGRLGYKGVSTRDIALAAEVSEVTVYRHYPRKRDLYAAVVTGELGQVYLRGDLLAQIAAASDARHALVRTFELIHSTVARRPEMLRLVLYSSLDNEGDLHALLKKHLGEFVEILARYLEPWVSRGELRCGNARAMILALVAIVVLHRPLQEAFPAGTADPEAAFEAFVEMCLGMRPLLTTGAGHSISAGETTNQEETAIG